MPSGASNVETDDDPDRARMKLVRRLIKKPGPKVSPTELRCTILLFVAIPTELEEVLLAALAMGCTVSKVQGNASEYYDLGEFDYRRVMVVRTEMGPFAFDGAAAKAIHCLIETQAAHIISVGMAFGTLPKLQSIGHVLVSTGILAYDRCHVVCGGRDGGSGKYPHHDYSQVPRLAASERLLAEFLAAALRPPWKGMVHSGLILSGGAIIHCEEFRDHLAQQCAVGRGDIAIGGDMEGVGILSASKVEEPNWIVIKGVSDFANSERHAIIEQTRRPACKRAAAFVLETLAAGRAT
jgi:nucleoside phosphorylase